MDKFGLDAELELKRVQKYDLGMQKKATDWIASVTGDNIEADFYGGIKNGVILCKLINAISPGSCKFVSNPKHYLEDKANVQSFLDGCVKIGVPAQDMCTALDLSETRKDLNQVLQCIYAIGRQAQAMGWSGPQLGVNYYITVEEQIKRKEKRDKERMEEEVRLKEKQESMRIRREQLENEKIQRRPESVKFTRNKIYARRNARKERGRSHLTRKEAIDTESENSRTPSPVRFGLDQEIHQKKQAKFDHSTEEVVLDWIEDVTGHEVDHLWKDLRTGTVLCSLINKIRPGLVKKIHHSKIPLLQRENINHFLEAATKLGVKNHNLFHINDLYEKKDLGAVVNCLYALHLLYKSIPIIPDKVIPTLPEIKEETTISNGDVVLELPAILERKEESKIRFIISLMLLFLCGGGYTGIYHLWYVVSALSWLKDTNCAITGVDKPCTNQLTSVHFALFDLLFKLLPISFFLSSMLVFWKGPRIVIWFGLASKIVGCFVVAFSGEAFNGLPLGFLLFFLGGPLFFTSAVSMFPLSITSICAVTAAYFSGSGFIFAIFEIFHQLGLSMMIFFISYAVSFMCLFGLSIFFPPESVQRNSTIPPHSSWKSILLSFCKNLKQIFSCIIAGLLLFKGDYLWNDTISQLSIITQAHSSAPSHPQESMLFHSILGGTFVVLAVVMPFSSKFIYNLSDKIGFKYGQFLVSFGFLALFSFIDSIMTYLTATHIAVLAIWYFENGFTSMTIIGLYYWLVNDFSNDPSTILPEDTLLWSSGVGLWISVMLFTGLLMIWHLVIGFERMLLLCLSCVVLFYFALSWMKQQKEKKLNIEVLV